MFLILLLSTFFCIQNSYGQNTVQGTISDTDRNVSINKAVIMLLNAKDSIVANFTRTDRQGRFFLTAPDSGQYICIVTYPNYTDYTDIIHLQNQPINLGKLFLINKGKLLQELVVKQRVSAIKLRGDTIEFAADSFHVQPNASVEDLLKKMPGMQVDRNGNITANGKAVPKVLVDGEEFFGNDPTLVTKNLRADMIDKVQLFDKQSKNAEFTGIDDGKKTKTINLVLKKDKKKGVFGKIDVGGGTNGMHNSQVMANKFNDKLKLSIYGTVASTGRVGLDWGDNESYGNNAITQMMEGGGVMAYTNDESFGVLRGDYTGQGIPLAQTGGIHFENKWNDDKTSLNANFKSGRLSIHGYDQTITQQNLDSITNFTNANHNFKNLTKASRGDLQFSSKLGQNTTLDFNGSVYLQNINNNSSTTSEMYRLNGRKLNTNNLFNSNNGKNNQYNTSLALKQNFKKENRIFTLTLNYNNVDNNTNGFLKSENSFYNVNNILDSTGLTDQLKTNVSNNAVYSLDATYTEPLSKKWNMSLRYAVGADISHSDILSFNKNQNNDQYDQIDSTYSNTYKFNQLTQGGGIFFNYSWKKFKFNFGSLVSNTHYKQTNTFRDTTFMRNFINWNPVANFNYKLNKTANIGIFYNGSMAQPSIDQLQPIASNTNPLNIQIGNPNLKPAFNHQFSLNFDKFDMEKGISYYGSLYFTINNNRITANTITDSIGASTTSYVNIGGNNNLNLFTSVYKTFKEKNLRINFSPRFNRNNVVSLVNGDRNNQKISSYSSRIGISNTNDSIVSLNLSFTPTYNTNISSFLRSQDAKYWQYELNPELDYYMPWHLTLHTDLNYLYQAKYQTFSTQKRVIWNAFLERKFLQKDQLKLRFFINDILNQNKGINRYSNTNYITQNTYQTIRRYFLISAIWNFSKM